MDWITVHPNGKDSKGQPIPVKEGQSKGEAVKSFISKHQKSVNDNQNKSIDELKAKAQEVDNNDSFDIEDKEAGRKWHNYKKDDKYYSDYSERLGGEYKQSGPSREMAREEYLESKFSKTLNDLGIDFKESDISGDNRTINFYFDSPEEQTSAYRKVFSVLGNERSVMNFKDSLAISVDSHEEHKVKSDSEKDTYVKNAIASGKYKGTSKEVFDKLFYDSPYSIHSAEQIRELVNKYYKG
jgi:hypothetical protein